jgi:hypothetical protein
MPQQETYYEQTTGAKTIAVLKSYDRAFAREVFDGMDSSALAYLRASLSVEASNDVASSETESSDAIWEELEEGSREGWNSFSYFIVTETSTGASRGLFVSADWPTAEAFAKTLATA